MENDWRHLPATITFSPEESAKIKKRLPVECSHYGRDEVDPEDVPALMAPYGHVELCINCSAWLAPLPK